MASARPGSIPAPFRKGRITGWVPLLGSPSADQASSTSTHKPFRAAINEKLLNAAATAGKKGILLVLENEMSCNTGTGAEAAQVLAAVNSPYLMVNWDPGNAAELGETPYPNGYELLPEKRIGHRQCKDATPKPDGRGYQWTAMGGGIIDWVGQFRALKRDGYTHAVSLETHWRGAGTPEESTRQSWAGMRKDLQGAGAL